MSRLSHLQSATDLSDVARLLGLKPQSLSHILYVKRPASMYKKFDIPKRAGGTRQICAPIKELKYLQRQLAELLQDYLEEINKTKNRNDDGKYPDRIAHGFKRRRSIITNARQHRNRRYVFNVDIQHFFNSINLGRVRGYFMADNNFKLHPKVATIFAQIACFENALPQGSPCSPIISNLIGHIVDIPVAKLAARVGCTYTRYADDLTFSTNEPTFPAEIARQAIGKEHSWLPGNELSQLIGRCGFALNQKKTRMQYRDSRQEVTGLIVNCKINVRREYRHTVRAMVHRLFTRGDFDFKPRNAEPPTVDRILGRPSQLHGMLGFIDRIDMFNEKFHPRVKNRPLSSKESMYRRFLLFKEFYAAPAPVVVCEGKTDNVYITHAIRSLATEYPKLADVSSDGKITIKLRRFRYTDSSTGRILGIHGGTGNPADFIRTYKTDTARFKAAGMRWPVILLIDNDSGKKGIVNIIKEIVYKKIEDSDPNTYIVANLYLIMTPLPDGANSSAIEDFFDDSVKKAVWNGKTFSQNNDFDRNTNYGKADFAHRIVKPNADKINFSGFKPILDRFVSVLDEHAARFPPASST